MATRKPSSRARARPRSIHSVAWRSVTATSGAWRLAGRHLDPDLSILDMDGIRRDRVAAGRHQALAGAHVEHPAMPRARQTGARELALAERPAVMGAAVVAGVDGVADADEDDARAVGLDEPGLPGRDLVEARHADPRHRGLQVLFEHERAMQPGHVLPAHLRRL